jgi:aspartate aminotransferase
MFKEASFEIKRYRYFDKKTVGLDATGMLEDLKVRESMLM